MSWIRTDYDFGAPYARFTISVREVVVACEIRDKLNEFQNNPVEIEKFLKSLILLHRPNLKDCAIMSIQFTGMRFEIVVIHPDLPRVSVLHYPEAEPLIPQERACDGILIHDQPLSIIGKGGSVG